MFDKTPPLHATYLACNSLPESSALFSFARETGTISEKIAWMLLFLFSTDGLFQYLRSVSAPCTALTAAVLAASAPVSLLTSPLQLAPMESVVKSDFRAPVKQLQCCISAVFPEDKDCQALGGCIKGPAEQNQRTQDKKSKRDVVYPQRKAERAAIRTHIREKYQLPKNKVDKKQLEVTGGEGENAAGLRGCCEASGHSRI
ncbi:uncharacterized protein LOC120390125 [Mauremys reevesii]|uniref:uncharacterized protein LOC120390125 n=1 Tax=Mauremys reevesii TaxID=260615 RepID=UPI00193EEDB4|nr:uncharacterized protein LOC120390125 [Mauremys reevesii]